MPDSHFPLSRFSLHAPTEALGYWFVSHDFADALGMEYSRDAARELKGVLRGIRARIDYEGDGVTVRIQRTEDVIPTLRAIYRRLEWPDAELDEIEKSVRTYKRPRPKKIAVGDTFLIPVTEDLFGLGQVLEITHRAPTVAIFRCVGRAEEIEATDPTTASPLSILHLGLGCSLYTGGWPVVGSHRVGHSPSGAYGGARHSVGAHSFGGDGVAVQLLRAHAGLESWEQQLYGEPGYLRKFVLG